VRLTHPPNSHDQVEMLSERWKTWVMLSLLASATCLVVACGESNSSSGGQGHVPDASADVGMPDASSGGPACSPLSRLDGDSAGGAIGA
jgi:hypothetical protein